MNYLKNLKKLSRQNFVPVIKDDGCKFLVDFCKQNNPKNILEIGTAVGYSGSYMLLNSPNSFLTTIEIDQNSYNQAIQTFTNLNLLSRVKLILGDAKDVIPKLNQKYDLIFLDGPKGQYLNYLPYLLNLLDANGVIIADNVLFQGKVRSDEIIPHKHRAMINKLREFLKHIETNPKLNTKIYEIGDGIAVIKLKN